MDQLESGTSQRQIAKNLDLPLSNINKVTAQFQNNGKTCPSPRSGRPKSSGRSIREVKRIVEKDPRSSAFQVTDMVQKSVSTVRRYLHALSCYGSSETKAPPEFWNCHLFR